MADRVVVFNGSKRDFNEFIKTTIPPNEETIPFMKLIQHYNARLRPNESGVKESSLQKSIHADNCVVTADDYGSVLAHVISNFANIVTLNHDIGTLYLQNPPRAVIESLKADYTQEIEYHSSQYPEINREILADIYSALSKDVLGQEKCKHHIISGIYRLTTGPSKKPVVLMLYGPSGVGKTESAKSISRTLGGELLRVQFSMMQTQEAVDYVFGAEHSKVSFARDMAGRESNVILIDEFDKVPSLFYNAFYELFDEGRFVDTNYDIDLGQAIFLLTCNYRNEDEIMKSLGPAMFSRIGDCIEFVELSTDNKIQIINGRYKEILDLLKPDEKEYVESTRILSWFIENAERYDNVRILKTKLENAVFEKLTDKFVIQET